MGYEQLTSSELIQKLQNEELTRRALEAELAASDERDGLLHALQEHQHELEAQNETLRQSQRELQDSRKLYLDLYDSAPIPYCTLDSKGIIREINLPGAEMLGKSRALIIGVPLIAVASIKERARLWQHLRDCLAAQGPVTCEITISIGESLREFQLRSTAVREPSRPIETCRTAFLDITDLRAAERRAEAAHARERTMRTQLESVDRASAAANTALASLSGEDIQDFLQVIVDQARAMVDAEYAALGIADAAGEAFDPWVFAGMSRTEAASIGRAPRALGLLGAMVDNDQPLRVRERREHPASSALPAQHPEITSLLGVPIRYQGQKRGQLYLANKRTGEFSSEDQFLIERLAERAGVAMEIARLRQFEAHEHAVAKLSADRLTSAIESIEDALALYDANTRLVLCNSAYRTLVGRLMPGAFIGKPYAEMLGAWQAEIALESDDERAQLTAAQWTDLREPRRFELRTRDGRYLRVMNRPTLEGGIVQTVWDLTDDVRRERELSEARDVAERASAAKSDFLSSMSHELRTPLNAILGFAQLLVRDKKASLDDRHRHWVDHILKSGEHLLCLINDVLELSQIESGRLSICVEPVALTRLLKDVATALGPMTERAQIELIVEPSPDHVAVMADPTRLKQILMNYGSNAIKYGRKGGRISIGLSLRNGNARLTVSDDGLGIAPEKQSKIFVPFERAGQEMGSIEGTGIGLAISKRLAELMRGSVGFHSVEGRGSDFWVELPTHKTAEALPESNSPVSEVASKSLLGPDGPRYVLVCIEDHPSNAALLKDILADFERIELVVAASAEEGIELVRARLPDAVIMDINLPGMNGIEARQLLRQAPETRNIPVIALSAAATVEDASKIEAAGFQRYLTKPVQVDALALALEDLLLGRPTAG